MEVIPAIDLMGGRVVRLTRGDPNRVSEYPSFGDPVQVAVRWEGEGADALHVVDLDAAFGTGSNRTTLQRILKAVRIPVQHGGGIRRAEDAENMLRAGVQRVIVGTMAFKRTADLTRLIETFGGERLIISLDYQGDKVRVWGWRSETSITLLESVECFTKLGLRIFLLTSISQDGTLEGPDYNTLQHIVGSCKAKVIAAGGVGHVDDLSKLREMGVWGVVIGKALYEGRFSLKEAITAAKG